MVIFGRGEKSLDPGVKLRITGAFAVQERSTVALRELERVPEDPVGAPPPVAPVGHGASAPAWLFLEPCPGSLPVALHGPERGFR